MSNTGTPHNDATILRADSVAAWREGERHLEQATQDVAALKKQAQEDAVRERERGWQAGFDEGRQAGLEEAAQLALQLTAEHDAYLDGLTLQLASAIDASVRKILAGLDDAELIAAVARKAIEDMQALNTITLRVPPAMVNALQVKQLCFKGKPLSVRADDALHDDICYLDTPLGTVELTAQTQWARIFRTMSPASEVTDAD